MEIFFILLWEIFFILLWEWEGNGNTVMGMGGNGIKKVFPHISTSNQIISFFLIFRARILLAHFGKPRDYG